MSKNTALDEQKFIFVASEIYKKVYKKEPSFLGDKKY